MVSAQSLGVALKMLPATNDMVESLDSCWGAALITGVARNLGFTLLT